jgi:hypothetical protein
MFFLLEKCYFYHEICSYRNGELRFLYTVELSKSRLFLLGTEDNKDIDHMSHTLRENAKFFLSNFFMRAQESAREF